MGKQTYNKSKRDENVNRDHKLFKSLSSSSRIVFRIIVFLPDPRLGSRIFRLHIVGPGCPTAWVCAMLLDVMAVHRTARLFGLGWSRSLPTDDFPTQQVNAFSPVGFWIRRSLFVPMLTNNSSTQQVNNFSPVGFWFVTAASISVFALGQATTPSPTPISYSIRPRIQSTLIWLV